MLTVSVLKQMSRAMGREIYEVFDVIAGTSTGGIIASLIGLKCTDVDDAERIYDELIPEIFVKRKLLGPIKLGLQQAYYDDANWERVLRRLCGEQRMMDSMSSPFAPAVMTLATVISVEPAKVFLSRNMDVARGQQSRYLGGQALRVREAIRCTTAAPTLFTPLEIDGTTYCDGAFFANNPSAAVFNEAQRLYPGVPVECLVRRVGHLLREGRRLRLRVRVGHGGECARGGRHRDRAHARGPLELPAAFALLQIQPKNAMHCHRRNEPDGAGRAQGCSQGLL